MKYIYVLLILFLAFSPVCGQENLGEPIRIGTFISFFDKSITDIDNILSSYGARLWKISKEDSSISWKSGFNGDHTKNNQWISYAYSANDSSILYAFFSVLHSNSHHMTFEEYYQSELSQANYAKLPDSVDKFGELDALVKNYRYEKYIIKFYKISGSEMSALRISIP